MRRREFLTGSAAAVAASSVASGATTSKSFDGFKLEYAPHEGMFREHAGPDLFDQLRFMRDEGFRAFEDNWASRRPVDVQEKLGKTLAELGMTMGVFVAHGEFSRPSFASDDPAQLERILNDMRSAVEAAERLGAKWCTVVPGAFDQRLEPDYQMALVVDNLRRCAEILEPAGLTIVLESLNPWRDHPGLYLTKIPQAYMICRAVNSPSVKILDDLYHQQITEGNLIPNLDRAWDEIAYIQLGDNPGRNEPGTGEIQYRKIFEHLYHKGYQGVLGMEHGNSRGGKEGERAVIDAYRAADDFPV
ncbi:MAG: TIM barrel protein [Planctomycetes bacterium]|nr:TIM barrel protein [Planctomycetota bacterium]